LAASSVIDLTGPGAAVAGGRPASVLAKRLHRSGPAASPHHRLPRAEPFDAEAFVAAMGADMDMAAIMADNRQRAAKSLEAYKQRMASLTARRSTPKAIMVPKRGAAAGPGAGFGLGAEPAYTELQQVLLDDRVRVMSFYEDQRPAYVGTFSKRSTFVTGRRPLGQDHRQLNYDYDSEEEWEEADEGEDIADSDGEEEEGDNELEYNDFFRRDNDYGSDVDSDGEGVAAAIVQRREGEECIGPRFLRKAAASPRDGTPAQPLSLRLCPETRSLVGCLDKEKDVQRLRSYPAVVYSYAALASAVPVLGVKSEESLQKLTNYFFRENQYLSMIQNGDIEAAEEMEAELRLSNAPDDVVELRNMISAEDVVYAIRNYMEDMSIEGPPKSAPQAAHTGKATEEDIRIGQKRLMSMRNFWINLGQIVSDESVEVWQQLERDCLGLHELLNKRAANIAEVDALTLRNAELKKLLNNYLGDTRTNGALQVPPAQVMRVRPSATAHLQMGAKGKILLSKTH
jgi:hypothetical protein